MRRLLMISPHFPPDSSAATHRVRLLAPHLPAHGWEPVVLTLDTAAYEGRLDSELADLVPSSLRVVRADAWSPRMTRLVRFGDLGLRGYQGLRRAALDLCSRERFDAVFITIYPTYPAAIGPLLKRRCGLPFVLDYQDPWVSAWGQMVGPQGEPDLKSRLSLAVAHRMEPHVLGAADGVTAVSARTYEDALERTGCRPRAVDEIPIGWDAGDFARAEQRPPSRLAPPADGLVHFSYVGTLLPLGVEVLRTLLHAVRMLRERCPQVASRVRFHFVGTSNQSAGAERVMPHAREFGIADLVDEHAGRVDYLDALSILRRSSALLLLGSTEAHYTPSKAFPAMVAARPLLALHHVESPIVDLLLQVSPESQLLTYRPGELCQPPLVERVVQGLMTLADPARREPSVNLSALEPWSAHQLAGRLARICDAVAA